MNAENAGKSKPRSAFFSVINGKRRLQVLCQEFDHVVGVYEFEGSFSGGVVAAGQHNTLQIGAAAAELCFNLAGEFRQKRKIVFRVDQQTLLRKTRELVEIGHRTDAEPCLTQ